MTRIVNGDVGTVILLTPSDGDDISTGISPRIDYVKPSGVAGSWTATIETGDVATGQIRYVTSTGDIDEVGTWLIQGFVNLGSWAGSTSAASFDVAKKL